jgi:hypothetical protein
MSWDVLLFPAEGAPAPGEEIPEGWSAAPLGPLDEVRSRISGVIPAVAWDDKRWGTLEGPGWSIEFNGGRQDPIDGLMLHIRGSGDPLPVLSVLCQRNSWAALDLSTGEFLDLSAPSSAGWTQFQEFRDQLLRNLPKTTG